MTVWHIGETIKPLRTNDQVSYYNTMSPYLDFWAHQPCGGGPSTMAMIYKIQLPLWWSSRSVIFVNFQAVFNSSSNCLQSLKECSKSIRSLKYLVLLSCSDDLYCFTCVRCECALCSGLAPCTSGSTPVLNHYQVKKKQGPFFSDSLTKSDYSVRMV